MHAATKFAKRFKDPENEFDDADRKIFGKLPQEYQDEIDARVLINITYIYIFFAKYS